MEEDDDRLIFKFIPIIINISQNETYIKNYKDINGNNLFDKFNELIEKRKKYFWEMYNNINNKINNYNFQKEIFDYIFEVKNYCFQLFNNDTNNIIDVYFIINALITYINSIILLIGYYMCFNQEKFIKNKDDYYKICKEFNEYGEKIQYAFIPFYNFYSNNILEIQNFNKKILTQLFNIKGSNIDFYF